MTENSTDMREKVLSLPEEIYNEQIELIGLLEEESKLEESIKLVRSNISRDVENEWVAGKHITLSTVGKRELEVELRIKESKSGSLILPKLADVKRRIQKKRYMVERLQNVFKAVRVVLSHDEHE